MVPMRLGAATGLGQAVGEGRVGRQAAAIGSAIRRSVGAVDRRKEAGAASPWPSPPPVSPTNGMCWRSTASRLIRRAAVFCVATSRT